MLCTIRARRVPTHLLQQNPSSSRHRTDQEGETSESSERLAAFLAAWVPCSHPEEGRAPPNNHVRFRKVRNGPRRNAMCSETSHEIIPRDVASLPRTKSKHISRSAAPSHATDRFPSRNVRGHRQQFPASGEYQAHPRGEQPPPTPCSHRMPKAHVRGDPLQTPSMILEGSRHSPRERKSSDTSAAMSGCPFLGDASGLPSDKQKVQTLLQQSSFSTCRFQRLCQSRSSQTS